MYGESILFNQEPYITQMILTKNITRSTAQADVQNILGISKWISESNLYVIVKKLFPEYKIEREASPEWLGMQRFDIYIPAKKLAIEYQGQQHYQIVPIFGGEDALARNIERDKEKQSKCKANGVNLIYFRYDEPQTEDYVLHKLRGYLTSG